MNNSNETISFTSHSNNNNNNQTVNNLDQIELDLLPIKLIMIIATVLMNLTILNAILFKVKRKKYSYYLFLSITTGDLIVGVSSMSFMTICTNFLYWPLGYGLCVFWIIVDYSTSTVNLFTILLLTIQRFMLIKHPFKTKETFTWRKSILILSIWAFGYSYWIGSVLAVTFNPFFDHKSCYFTYTFIYVLTADLINYGLPVLLTTIFSIFTMFTLIRNRKLNSISVNSNLQLNKIKARKTERAFLCIMLVALNIISFWMLFIVCWPVNAYCNGCLDSVLMEVSYWLAYFASTTNPIILLIFNKSIRKRCVVLLKSLFLVKKRTNNGSNSTNQHNQQKTDSYT